MYSTQWIWKDAANPEQIVFAVVSDCFLRHPNSSKHFAAGIFHRHVGLAPDEWTFETDGKAVVVKEPKEICASSGMLSEGNWYL